MLSLAQRSNSSLEQKYYQRIKKLVVASFYRPPNMVDEQYRVAAFTEFTGLRKQFKNSMYILAGDFNLLDVGCNVLNIKNDNQYPI